jgi:hypothetical protein
MLQALLKLYPENAPQHLSELAEIWEVQCDRVIRRMLAMVHEERGATLPANAREDLIFELAKLRAWLEGRVIAKNCEGKAIEEIVPADERLALQTPFVQQRIENTARLLADSFWTPLVARQWERHPLVESPTASKRRMRRLSRPGRESQGVRKQHYSPLFANRYWTSGPRSSVRRYTRGMDFRIVSRDVGIKTWARAKCLYSQQLEAHLQLIEGDAERSYSKLLQVVPLNEADRRHWIAFLIAQRLRTPRAIRWQLAGLRRIIRRDHLSYSTSIASLRAVYETVFTNNVVFARFYELLMSREWQLWRAPISGYFIRSDEPVSITGSLESREWQLIYPMSPKVCFAVGPAKASQDTARRIVPSGRTLSYSEMRSLNHKIARSARLSVIGPPLDDDSDLRDQLTVSLGMADVESLDLEQSLIEYWGALE